MTRVSIVMPALGDTSLLERHLPPLLEEIDGRGGGDEVWIVDDTGENVLKPWLDEHFPAVRVLAHEHNEGFARALLHGAQSARGDLLFATNPDVLVRPHFLDPLVEAMADEQVFAVTPRVLIGGDEQVVESHNALGYEDGRLRVTPRDPQDGAGAARPVPFASGAAMLVRREEFLDSGGFDPLYFPFFFEDVDLGLHAWKRGRTVLEVPTSVVEHHNRGTIDANVPGEVVQAAIEKNRLLLLWKFLDSPGDAQDHLTSLWRDALDAALAGRREELIWIAMALQEMANVGRSRSGLADCQCSLEQVLRVSDPVGGR